MADTRPWVMPIRAATWAWVMPRRRRGLPRAQLKHLQQARILRPQTPQLRGYSRGNLSHAHTIRNRGHVAHAGVLSDGRATHGGYSVLVGQWQPVVAHCPD